MTDQHQTDPEASAELPKARSPLEEREYFLRRAQDHRNIAEMTEEPGARAIHMRLHQLYLERADLVVVVLPD